MELSPFEAASYGEPLVGPLLRGGFNEILCKDDYGFMISSHYIDALAEKVVFYVNKQS